jgi:hypothetical protein
VEVLEIKKTPFRRVFLMFLKSLKEKNMTLLIKRKLLTCVNISNLYLAIAKRLKILLT